MFFRNNCFDQSPQETTSSFNLLKSSHSGLKNTQLHPVIDVGDIKENGFLSSDIEKKRLLLYMKQHASRNEKISTNSVLCKDNPGAILINREREKIYKIYHPETNKEKCSRKELFKELKIKKKPKGFIGYGAYGKVGICQDLVTGQWFAVKIIQKSVFEKLASFSRLSFFCQPNEIEFLKLQNLFIDFIETSNKFYIIQKLINGKNLVEFFEKDFFTTKDYNKSIDTFFGILIKMAEAVENFHRKNCLHRDIGPDNFLYDEIEQKIYLIDYGFSIKLECFNDIYRLGGDGKKAFIAPEIQSLGVSIYSYASDIYALGKTFKWLKSELLSKLNFEYPFISRLNNLIVQMTNPDRHLRPDFFYIYDKINSIMEDAIIEHHFHEEENNSKYPWQIKLMF